MDKDLIDLWTSRLPTRFWVELTSTCPYRCRFCSRHRRFGAGRHLDYDLYRRFLDQLKNPEIIRLNYSGESLAYPRLREAIESAAATGAATELVTALIPSEESVLQDLVESPLNRLSISMHTLEAAQFPLLYGGGSLQRMLDQLDFILKRKQERDSRRPTIDFCMVVMHDNLAQLERVLQLAEEKGVDEIHLHPVILRHAGPQTFSREFSGQDYSPDFIQEVNRQVGQSRSRHPQLRIAILNPRFETTDPSTEQAGDTLGTGPIAGVPVFSDCEQNPWETLHLLSDGKIVVCEAHDEIPMGDLNQAGLEEIWHSDTYRRFRRTYLAGENPTCNRCPWRSVRKQSRKTTDISGRDRRSEAFLRGWHSGDDGDIAWSKPEAWIALSGTGGPAVVKIQGILPPGEDSAGNRLHVACNGSPLGTVVNEGTESMPFEKEWPCPAENDGRALFHFRTEHAFRPWKQKANSDIRCLGFALQRLNLRESEEKLTSRWPFWKRLTMARLWVRLYRLFLWIADRSAARIGPHYCRRFVKRIPEGIPGETGFSVLIPERGNPELLEQCLEALAGSLGGIEEPWEVIVVVSGSDPSDYQAMSFPSLAIRWLFHPQPLFYTQALQKGLDVSRFPWVYLLNNDMVPEVDTIRMLLPWRCEKVFSIASQIFFLDPDRRREETGWTGFSIGGGRVDLFDREPDPEPIVRGNLYGGGGSSLFQKRLLAGLLRDSHTYAPFYWEDVEWGVRAWRLGYFSLFCPSSRIRHHQRVTNRKYFSGAEIERIFRRNRFLFEMRNRLPGAEQVGLQADLISAPRSTKQELSRPSILWGILASRWRESIYPYRPDILAWVNQKYFLRPWDTIQEKPSVLLVTPYAIFPPTHGGAVRIWQLLQALRPHFSLSLLTDEWQSYAEAGSRYLSLLDSLHLVGGRTDDASSPEGRERRMESHSHPNMRQQLSFLQRSCHPDIVQIEFAELARLIEEKEKTTRWCLSLHDVYQTEEEGRLTAEDEREMDLFHRYDSVFVCSEEDARLLPRLPVHVIPNGVSQEFSRNYRPSLGNKALLFAGVFRYRPNFLGIVAFLETVWDDLRQEVPDVELWILGGAGARERAGNQSLWQKPGVTIFDYVEHPVTFLERCALSVNPLLGIRGSSLKVAESLAAGRVCLSTEDGARGFGERGYRSLLTVPSIADFTGPLVRLLTDTDYRVSIERLSPEEIEGLSWKLSAEKQIGFYRELLQNRPDRNGK